MTALLRFLQALACPVLVITMIQTRLAVFAVKSRASQEALVVCTMVESLPVWHPMGTGTQAYAAYSNMHVCTQYATTILIFVKTTAKEGPAHTPENPVCSAHVRGMGWGTCIV